LKDGRAKKRYSRERVAKATKIKLEFIEAIEKEDWERLPEFPAILGFVKSVAEVLKLSKRQVAALLRRDYPPKVLPVNPKPDVSAKFTWSPRLTFFCRNWFRLGHPSWLSGDAIFLFYKTAKS